MDRSTVPNLIAGTWTWTDKENADVAAALQKNDPELET